MAKVDPIEAQWLQSEGQFALAKDAALLARWGDSAISAERMTPLVLSADANAEGARVLAFRGQPMVEEEAVLVGAFVRTIGTVITIQHDTLGYGGGLQVFVIGAEDDHAKGTSRVTFLRRLT